MEQNRNKEQGGTAAAVPAEKKNENRKREVSGKDAQIIRAFLESVGIYEADGLTVHSDYWNVYRTFATSINW